jgi:hypothetical protein
MNDVPTPQKKELDLNLRLGQLRQLEAKIATIEKKHKEELKPYKEASIQLRAVLMQWLTANNLKTSNTRTNGSFTWVDKITFPMTDQHEFMGFVIEHRAWDLVDWKANATAVKAFAEEHKDVLPEELRDTPHEHEAALPPGLRPSPHPYLRIDPPENKTRITARTTEVEQFKTDTELTEEG